MVGFLGGIVRQFVKLFEVVDLGVADRLILNSLDHPFKDTDPHSKLLNAKGCKEPRKEVYVDLHILKPFAGFLGPLPKLVEMFLKILNLRPERIV